MKDSGKIMHLTERGHINFKTEATIKASGKITKSTDMEFMPISMETSTKGNFQEG